MLEDLNWTSWLSGKKRLVLSSWESWELSYSQLPKWSLLLELWTSLCNRWANVWIPLLINIWIKSNTRHKMRMQTQTGPAVIVWYGGTFAYLWLSNIPVVPSAVGHMFPCGLIEISSLRCDDGSDNNPQTPADTEKKHWDTDIKSQWKPKKHVDSTKANMYTHMTFSDS